MLVSDNVAAAVVVLVVFVAPGEEGEEQTIISCSRTKSISVVLGTP
jgi:hypothetical protein